MTRRKNTKDIAQNGMNGHAASILLCKNDVEFYGDSKETFQLPLGTYRACTIPMCVLVFGYGSGFLTEYLMTPDPRVKDWPLMSSSVNLLIICVLYILLSVVWGPNLMKNREPLNLKKTMIAYNAFQVVLSTYMFLEVGFAAWFFDYNYLCEPCDHSDNPKAVRVASVAWVFFLSKLLDFIDTIFFVLHKKWNQISTLHIVHHSTMCAAIWFGVKFYPGGHLTFFGYINSGVHIVMYTYYFLSAFGPKMRPYLWWKRYLTRIQLFQFVVVFLQSISSLFIDCPSIPIGLPIWTCVYAVIYFALFIDFYYRAYMHPAKLDSTSENKTEVLDHEDRSASIFNTSSDASDANTDVSTKQAGKSSNLNRPLNTCTRERKPSLTKD